MFTPFTSRHFTTHLDPVSGMKYAVLATRVAPIQQGFYFVNNSMTDDGRYLWFYCSFPPARGRSMAVIDFLTDEIHHYPETYEFDHAGWMVDTATGDLYWPCAHGIYRRSPHPAAQAVCVAPIPQELAKLGVTAMGTHIQFTADRKSIVTDIQTQMGSSVGSFDVLTGEYTEWYRTQPGVPYNHVQASPLDSDLLLCAHECRYDYATNTYIMPEPVDGVYPRLQLIRRDGSRRMLKPYRNFATHEFFSADGKKVYYCSRDSVGCNRLDGDEPEAAFHLPAVDGNGTWHAHCTRDEQYFIVDASLASMGREWWRGCPSMMRFYNRETGKHVELIHENPVVNGWTPENQSIYHIDPHPRFVLNDSLIVFTVTTQDKVDLAVAEVAPLIEATK